MPLIILGAYSIYEANNLGEVPDLHTAYLNQVAKDWEIVPFVEIQVTDDTSCEKLGGNYLTDDTKIANSTWKHIRNMTMSPNFRQEAVFYVSV